MSAAAGPNMPLFWQRWFVAWCGAVFVFGLALSLGAINATSGPTRLIFSFLDGPGELEMDAHMRFSMAVLGAVSMGWSITLLAAIVAAEASGRVRRPIWLLIFASVLAWFVIDSALSVYTGFWRNVIPNTVLLAGFVIPLIGSGVLRIKDSTG